MHQMPESCQTANQLLGALVKLYSGRHATCHMKALLVDEEAAHSESATCQRKQWNQSVLVLSAYFGVCDRSFRRIVTGVLRGDFSAVSVT